MLHGDWLCLGQRRFDLTVADVGPNKVFVLHIVFVKVVVKRVMASTNCVRWSMRFKKKNFLIGSSNSG